MSSLLCEIKEYNFSCIKCFLSSKTCTERDEGEALTIFSHCHAGGFDEGPGKGLHAMPEPGNLLYWRIIAFSSEDHTMTEAMWCKFSKTPNLSH